MSQQLGGQQVIILREGTTQNRGKEVQRSNIMAAKAIAGAVRSTLGPRGMDKMLVNQTAVTSSSRTMGQRSSGRSQ